MASNVTRDHHNLRRNLKLNDNYISNDGGDEGISIGDGGKVTMGETLFLPASNDVKIDKNVISTDSDAAIFGLAIDIDKTGATSNGNTIIGLYADIDSVFQNDGLNYMYGVRVNPTLTYTADAGAAIVYGYSALVTGSSNSASYGTGLDLIVTGSSTQFGILTKVDDGHIDIKMMSSADTGDYCSIATTTHGATTIATVDDANAEAAHLTFDIQGDTIFKGDIADGTSTEVARIDASASSLNMAINSKLTFGASTNFIYANANDSFMAVVRDLEIETGRNIDIKATSYLNLLSDDNILIDAVDALTIDTDGTFIMMKDGTEFSAANSAYAGMILGYTHLLSTDVVTSVTLGTSVAVIDADAKVTFIAPPSGNVEIAINVYRDSSTSSETLYFGLSDNATYNQLTAEKGDGSTTIDMLYTYGADLADETDDRYLTCKFVAGGLTAGDEYEWWLGAWATTGTTYLKWGGRIDTAPDRYYPPFIMKATALPATIYMG